MSFTFEDSQITQTIADHRRCGFGDSCKYLHAREDYKHGWQLDKEWETVTKGKKVAGTKFASADRQAAEEQDEDDSAQLEGIPFACIICSGSYKDPIVTKCGHYFCESCALKRYKRTPVVQRVVRAPVAFSTWPKGSRNYWNASEKGLPSYEHRQSRPGRRSATKTRMKSNEPKCTP